MSKEKLELAHTEIIKLKRALTAIKRELKDLSVRMPSVNTYAVGFLACLEMDDQNMLVATQKAKPRATKLNRAVAGQHAKQKQTNAKM